ncbi:MAG: hypothetical protein ACRDHS_03840, partial [Actinomycetota bacterium]
MLRHPTQSERDGISFVDVLRVEVHVPMPAGTSLVPHEAVANARRHEQEVAGREQQFLVSGHEKR